MIPFVGLTGGVGAGKSTALAALERLGAATLSTDQVVHELYGTTGVRDAVVERFGPRVTVDDEIDRAALATQAFFSPEDRTWLEDLLWPSVADRIQEWRQQLESRPTLPRAAVVEVPLLFEAGMEKAFDATIAVIADERVRVARASTRGHEALDERVARQLSQDEKAQRATYTVINDGGVGELETKLSAVLDMLGQ